MSGVPAQPFVAPGPEPSCPDARSEAVVLVVDDAPVDRRRAGGLVEGLGWQAAYAENGATALAAIETKVPAVVLTDLLMPEMDGLELVRAIRSRYPFLPVVLMTAHGSEEVAIRALRSGAASYVPKRSLAQDLGETLERVVAAAQARWSHQRLLACMSQVEGAFVLENDATLLAALTGTLQETLSNMGLCDETDRIRIGIALTEALTNAMYHGNLEISSELRQRDDNSYDQLVRERCRQAPYRDRRIHVTARYTLPEAVFSIRDEGPGFDPSRLPDPTDPTNLEKRSGRGLLLIRTFMDEVLHNATGNQITLIKRCKPGTTGSNVVAVAPSRRA
jgi:CheY-like chemotaxis protein/anti-sigma regulatory factor (Ser/Thr protein kinase)